jgi:transposase
MHVAETMRVIRTDGHQRARRLQRPYTFIEAFRYREARGETSHDRPISTVTVTAIEIGVPGLVEARERTAEFQAMVRHKTDADLPTWIAAARASLVASFASGVAKDEPAVRAAITLPWSNGQTEGQITKLKLVKRQMYGRPRSICFKLG